MTGVALLDIVTHVDAILRIREVPDYPPALNGLQVEHLGPVRGVAAAVDVSMRTIRGAIEARANLLLVHHGLFWGGLQPLTAAFYARVRLLLDHDVALYSAHLPLDVHKTYGNSVLLSTEVGLEPNAGFARFESVDCGVRGESDISTAEILERVRTFSRSHGGDAIPSAMTPDRRTKRWAICTGAGATEDTIREAVALGVDTLITGEGPHWTAVDADEKGLVIIYAGHYATETLGVRSLAEHVSAEFDLPWTFVAAPTGL